MGWSIGFDEKWGRDIGTASPLSVTIPGAARGFIVASTTCAVVNHTAARQVADSTSVAGTSHCQTT